MEDKWTKEKVIQRFKEAVQTARRLPTVKPQGYFTIWPEIKYRPNEMIFMDEKPKKELPNHQAISRMYQTCEWLLFLDNNHDSKIILMRAKLIHWKVICKDFGIGRSAINKRYGKALLVIVEKLNQNK